MKRTALVVAPLVAASLGLSACGSSSTPGAAASSLSASASAADGSVAGSATASAGATATDCPTDSTRHFAKTRFVADVGLAAGTFHRWIYKPYQEGTFRKGADGRTLAITKAVGVAALDAKLLNNAYDNVQADPTLCKALKTPLGKLKDSVNAMKGQITRGDLSSVVATESLVSTVLGSSQKAGLKIDETTDESVAQ